MVWQTLPYPNGQLECIAAEYYGCDLTAILAVPGSQYALQYTPTLLHKGAVAIPQRGYAEHRLAWEHAGHRVVEYNDGAALHALVIAGAVDHALVINPNNPTAEVISHHQLLDLRGRLHSCGGWLVVDEAFADADVAHSASLAGYCPLPGLAVYRSVGKFFGLAGIRLGFLLAPSSLCTQMQALMPPWLLSHPARWIGAEALRDREWQVMQQQRLQQTSEQWWAILRESVPGLSFATTALFATGSGKSAYCDALYQALGQRAILLRLFETVEGSRALRFGLPLPAELEQVTQSLREAVEECECKMR
jgi:cobalamin biosynthetic protein CobC